MSFFNLTMVGHPEPYRHYQTPEVDRSLPPINCPKMYTRHFSKPFDSNLKYHELRTKHIRHPQGPHQLFQKPLTTSQEVGWYTKDDLKSQNLKWTVVKKHVFPKSEMTQFAHNMSMKDKSFRMY